MRKFTLLILALAGCIGSGFAAEVATESKAAAKPEVKAADGATTVGKFAEEVLKHQQALEASVRENRTAEVKKHAEEAANAAGEAQAAAKAAGKSDVAERAEAALKTAKELAKIGAEGTIAEHGSLVSKLKEEAEALKKAAGSGAVASAGEPKMLGNTLCPISGEPVDSMGGPVYAVHDGYKVALCCGGCSKKFEANAAASLEKAKASVKK